MSEVESNPTGPRRWYIRSREKPKGPFPEHVVRDGIVKRKISLDIQAVPEGSDDWKPLNLCEPFVDVCAERAIDSGAGGITMEKVLEVGNTYRKVYAEKSRIVLADFQQTDFKDELLPFNEGCLRSTFKDMLFWVVLAMGVMPLLITSLNRPSMRLTGLLFFFAILWGGVFRSAVLKVRGSLKLPVASFFFTGVVGIFLLLFAYGYMPSFYMKTPDSDSPLVALMGCIFQTGVCEEICKAFPVVLYLLIKRRNAAPEMALLIGVFSGLGFAVFENIDYAHRAVFSAMESTYIGASRFGMDGALAGAEHGARAAMENIMLRSLSLVFVHGVFSGICAYFLTTAALLRKRWFALGTLAILVPAVLHGFYNWLSDHQPVFAALIVAVSFLLFYGYLVKFRGLVASNGE